MYIFSITWAEVGARQILQAVQKRSQSREVGLRKPAEERTQCRSPRRASPPTQPEEVSVLAKCYSDTTAWASQGLRIHLESVSRWVITQSLAHLFKRIPLHIWGSFDALLSRDWSVSRQTKRLLLRHEQIIYWRPLSDTEALRGCLLGWIFLRVNLFLVEWTSQLHNLF